MIASVRFPDSLIKFLASGAYLGYSPWVPGTVGSLGGVLVYLALVHWNFGPVFSAAWIIILIMGSIWVAERAEKIFGGKDPGKVVIDEVAGMAVTLYQIPFSWKWVAAGFVLFRILDVVKPFPARQCERLKGGLGIVLDDVVSGFYAWLLLWAIILLTQHASIP